MNPRLNIEEIVRCFPGQVAGSLGRPLYNLESPFEVALRENQLRKIRESRDLGPAVPAHYFVYALGETRNREQSRIGGVPYRPRDLEWPVDENGKPKEFVCQVDFTDSCTLLPPLPGDVMLLFATEEGSANQPFELEWYPARLTDLVRATDLPKFNFTFPMVQVTAHCYLYETHDYPEAINRIKGTEFEDWKTLGLPCGSKIGGHQETSKQDSRHIVTLESIRLSSENPFPFVNLKGWKASSLRERLAAGLVHSARKLTLLPERSRVFNVLMIGDLGRISVFQTATGQFEVESTSY